MSCKLWKKSSEPRFAPIANGHQDWRKPIGWQLSDSGTCRAITVYEWEVLTRIGRHENTTPSVIIDISSENAK